MHTEPPIARFANGERYSGGPVIAAVRGIIHPDDSCVAGAPVGESLVRLTSFSLVIGLRRDLIVDRAFVCSDVVRVRSVGMSSPRPRLLSSFRILRQ